MKENIEFARMNGKSSIFLEYAKTKAQLEIAKETLKKYAISDNYNFKNQCYPTVTNMDAIDALLKIEELDK